MRKEESKLWDRIKSNMSIYHSQRLRLERVEPAPGITDGIPDLHALSRGRASWVELKQVEDFPSGFSRVLAKDHQKLSIDQRNWHKDYHRCGGRVATLVGIGSAYYVLVDGLHSDAINEWSWPLMKQNAIAYGGRNEFFPLFYAWLDGQIS